MKCPYCGATIEPTIGKPDAMRYDGDSIVCCWHTMCYEGCARRITIRSVYEWNEELDLVLRNE